MEQIESSGMTLQEMRQKYIGRRFCIIEGKHRAIIGKCKWIEPRKVSALGETKTFIWFRLETEDKSYWAMMSQIVRIKDEPDEVPYYSGW